MLPFRETRSVIIQREGATFPYQRWEDLVSRKGLTVINNSFGQAFDRFANESLSLAKVSSLDQALQMLERGRQTTSSTRTARLRPTLPGWGCAACA